MLLALDKLAGILFGSGLTLLAAFLLGRLYQRFSRERLTALSDVEVRLFAFGVGAACLSQFVFLLAAARLIYDAVLLALAVGIIAAWWRWRPAVPSGPRFHPEEDHQAVWKTVFWMIATVYGVLYIVHAVAPETRSDAVGYHLGLVRRYRYEHGLVPIPTSFYAAFTQGAEMLYLFAFSFGRHSAAKLVHFGFFAALLIAMLSFARRYGVWRAGIVGALLFACSPVIVPDATSAYNDCALAFYVFLLFYGLLLWWKDPASIHLVTLGILAGFCFSLKYTGALALAALVPFVCWKVIQDKRGWRTLLGAAIVPSAVAALFISPWLIKNAVFVGSPVAPFLNEVFPSPHFTLSWEQEYREYFRTYSYTPEQDRWFTYPVELTLRGERLGGLLGPVFLLTPLALFAWRKPGGKPLLLAAAISCLPWFSNAGSRFLIPTLVFVSLALGLALLSLPSRWAAVVGCTVLLAHAASSWPTVLAHWAAGAWSIVGVPWKAALRIEPEREYLLRMVPHYHAAEVISAKVTPPGRVFSLEPLPEAYFDAELLVPYHGALNQELMDALKTAVEPDLWPSRQRRLSWATQRLHGFRIVQTNHHDSSWRMSEIRFLDRDGRPVGSDEPAQSNSLAHWTVTADPRPWHAVRIIDGDPLTGWNSSEPLRPGMRIEVRFADPLLLSGAELTYPWGQHFVELDYFALDASGEWRPLEARSGQARLPFSGEGLKKWAVRKLARHDIELLITNVEGGGNNYIAPLIEDNPRAWGLEEISRYAELRIYRLRKEELNLPRNR